MSHSGKGDFFSVPLTVCVVVVVVGAGGEGSVAWSVISKLVKSHNVLGSLSCPMHCSESAVGQGCSFVHVMSCYQ